MIHIWRISGEELAAVSTDRITSVRDVKQALKRLHGFPVFMQQLLHDGHSLDDCTRLASPCDLQLVLLLLCTRFQREQATMDYIAACKCGHVEAVRALLAAGLQLNPLCRDCTTGFLHAAQNGHVAIVRLLMETGDRHLWSGAAAQLLGMQ